MLRQLRQQRTRLPQISARESVVISERYLHERQRAIAKSRKVPYARGWLISVCTGPAASAIESTSSANV
jgi:hypothetical protein